MGGFPHYGEVNEDWLMIKGKQQQQQKQAILLIFLNIFFLFFFWIIYWEEAMYAKKATS